MELLEREPFLGALGDYATDAASGNGRLVMVTGEAGIGKTSLVDAFRATRPDITWHWSACDCSFTPRPLGPVHEIAARIGGPLKDLCRTDADRNELFTEFIAMLDAEPGVSGVVVEDVHWADEATLDWLGHLSRRLSTLRALVLVTLRDDEPTSGSPLPGLLGRIAAHDTTRRLTVPALTPGAVRSLTDPAEHDPERVFALTSGNPFFVREVLDVAPDDVPRSVADLVGMRAQRLSPDARRMLSAVAVLRHPATAQVLASVAGVRPDALDECANAGLIVADGAQFRFRHELARLAVEDSVPAYQAAELHRMALTVLTRDGADAAVLAHHAEHAGDDEALLRHALVAAAEATALGSRREAIEQYRRALRFQEALEPAGRAALHEGLGAALAMRDRWSDAARHWEQAIAIRRDLGEPEPLSAALRHYAECMWRLCLGREHRAAVEESYSLMVDAPDSAEKALALQSHASMTLSPDFDAVAPKRVASPRPSATTASWPE